MIHRKPSEEQFCEVRIPQWVGPRTWNREAAGSIPGSPKVISGSFRDHFFDNFGMSWDVSGSGLGTFSDGFGMVLKNKSGGVEKDKNVQKYKFSKMARSIFPGSGH